MLTLRGLIVGAYLWIMMILLGAFLFDIVVLYPAFFHDVPRSLAVSTEFMAVSGPGDVFRPLEMASLFVGAAAVAAAWRTRAAAALIATSVVVVLVANGLFSALYFWPANTVMFAEGLAVHSAEHLRAVADAFVGWNIVRMVATVVGAVCAFLGALRFHAERVRHRQATRTSSDGARPGTSVDRAPAR